MTPSLRRLSVLAMASALVVLAADVSCKAFDIPAEICNPSRQLQTSVSAPAECTRCLEERCCESVGVCENAPGCAQVVSNAYDCVLRADVSAARLEGECVKDAGITLGLDAGPSVTETTYRCMRDSCGTECHLPVCRVDPAVQEIQNPKCDSCFAGSCCRELNDCYGNRTCELTLECIVRDCKSELGGALKNVALGIGVPPDGIGPGADLCADGRAPNIPACVHACLCKYQSSEGLEPNLPFRLAVDVYRCAGRAKCGDVCVSDAGGP